MGGIEQAADSDGLAEEIQRLHILLFCYKRKIHLLDGFLDLAYSVSDQMLLKMIDPVLFAHILA